MEADRAALAAEYLPFSQSEHVDADDIAEYLPSSQSAHVDAELAPATVEYLPFSQSAHVDAELAPPVPENLPASHLTQGLEPVTVLYSPDGHV